MIAYLPDTNVLSRIFKGDLDVTKFVESLESAIDATIYIECLQGSKSNYEKRVIEKYLTRFPLLQITPECSTKAIELIRNYSNSYGLMQPDALIAATALENDLTLLTYNVDDLEKVLVIGSSGAGKSTFSKRLGEATKLKIIHLDKLHWKPNWVEPSKDEWKETVENILKEDAWIIDGNYSGTLEMRLNACDTVIFLDTPRTICVWRVLKRVTICRKRSRPDMAAGCNEQFDWEFIKLTWNYPKRSKPKVEALLKKYNQTKNVLRLRSSKDIENFFTDLSKN